MVPGGMIQHSVARASPTLDWFSVPLAFRSALSDGQRKHVAIVCGSPPIHDWRRLNCSIKQWVVFMSAGILILWIWMGCIPVYAFVVVGVIGCLISVSCVADSACCHKRSCRWCPGWKWSWVSSVWLRCWRSQGCLYQLNLHFDVFFFLFGYIAESSKLLELCLIC